MVSEHTLLTHHAKLWGSFLPLIAAALMRKASLLLVTPSCHCSFENLSLGSRLVNPKLCHQHHQHHFSPAATDLDCSRCLAKTLRAPALPIALTIPTQALAAEPTARYVNLLSSLAETHITPQGNNWDTREQPSGSAYHYSNSSA